MVDDDGALVTTTHPLDLAVSGSGMLPVTSAVDLDNGFEEMPFMMTRTGSFRPDNNGVLRTDAGLVLMGWPASSDGTVPLSSRDAVGALEPIRLAVNQTMRRPDNAGQSGPEPARDRNGADGKRRSLFAEGGIFRQSRHG